MTESTTQTNRYDARRLRDSQTLRTLTGRVRATNLTPDGHAACIFDTPAGRLRALSDAGGVKKRAAELLGINYRSFRHRLQKYGLGGLAACEHAEDVAG